MKRFGLLLLGVFICARAWSLESDLSLEQLNHKRWTVANGAPGEIVAIAQTFDGTLWVGSSAGLFRFDGIRFVPYAEPAEQPFVSKNVAVLTTTPDGALWIGFRFGGVSVLKAGRMIHYSERDGVPDGTVRSITVDLDGSIVVAARGGLARLRGAHWSTIVIESSNPPSPYGALVDHEGTLWVLTADRVLARPAGESGFREMAPLAYASRSSSIPFAMAPDGSVWTSDKNGPMRLGSPTVQHPSNSRLPIVLAGGVFFDRAGNMWIAGPILRRLPAHALASGGRDIEQNIEDFAPNEGLPGAWVHCLFQDREGNVWLGTNTGLDRFSQSNIVRVPWPPKPGSTIPQQPETAVPSDGAPTRAPEKRDSAHRSPPFALGVPQAIPGGLVPVAGDAGTIWGATGTTLTDGLLLKMKDNRVVEQHAAPVFSSGYRDPDGSVWFGGATGLAHIQDGQISEIPLPQEAGKSEVQAMVRDGAGALWVSVIRKGVFRFSNGQWIPYGNLAALPRLPPIVETADERGALWFGYPANRIARVDGTAVRLFDNADGLTVGTVTAIETRHAHVWVGGEFGVAHFDGSRFTPLLIASGNAFTGISGIVETESGDLWLHGNMGIAHISHEEVEHLIQDPSHRVRYELFGYLDGLPGSPVQLRPTPSAFEGTDGRLWFNTQNGLVSMDQNRNNRNPLPPPVTIWSISSGGIQYSAFGAPVHLPVHSTSLEIDYTAGSLTIPERVLFRYKLEGLDSDWQYAGDRRTAIYTNLPPGEYRFRVIACNNDGVWNNTGASLSFTINPAFYQTKWFYALCLLAVIAALWIFYRVLVHQIRMQTRRRLEERLVERERIARDLHDTLLQGLQGLVLRFQVVANRMQGRDPTHELMESALKRADQLVIESRNRVSNLRASGSEVATLPEAIAAEGLQLSATHTAEFRISFQGVPRDLHPIVREEALLIGREALANAFRHSGARHIEAEVAYSETVLTVRIRDDGKGIGADVLQAGGQAGHWGLLGMRERAAKIRAHLDIWSKVGAGTEVELRVPAEMAYQKRRSPFRTWWWWHRPLSAVERNHTESLDEPAGRRET